MIRPATLLLLTMAPPLLALSGAVARAEPQPVIILTDTLEYCEQLQHRTQQWPVLSPDVKYLIREGHQMCDHGEIRGGINRLRRALRILNHHTPAP
jgi:hypothetical protein